jgi:hypothetical protein
VCASGCAQSAAASAVEVLDEGDAAGSCGGEGSPFSGLVLVLVLVLVVGGEPSVGSVTIVVVVLSLPTNGAAARWFEWAARYAAASPRRARAAMWGSERVAPPTVNVGRTVCAV